MAEHFASVSEDVLREKCIIKQLLNSEISYDIMNCQNLVSVLSAEAETQTSVLIIHDSSSTLSNNCLLSHSLNPGMPSVT